MTVVNMNVAPPSATSTLTQTEVPSTTQQEIVLISGTLYLEGRSLNSTDRRVQFEQDVIDNEFLNRKSSKSGLIFKYFYFEIDFDFWISRRHWRRSSHSTHSQLTYNVKSMLHFQETTEFR